MVHGHVLAYYPICLNWLYSQRMCSCQVGSSTSSTETPAAVSSLWRQWCLGTTTSAHCWPSVACATCTQPQEWHSPTSVTMTPMANCCRSCSPVSNAVWCSATTTTSRWVRELCWWFLWSGVRIFSQYRTTVNTVLFIKMVAKHTGKHIWAPPPLLGVFPIIVFKLDPMLVWLMMALPVRNFCLHTGVIL